MSLRRAGGHKHCLAVSVEVHDRKCDASFHPRLPVDEQEHILPVVRDDESVTDHVHRAALSLSGQPEPDGVERAAGTCSHDVWLDSKCDPGCRWLHCCSSESMLGLRVAFLCFRVQRKSQWCCKVRVRTRVLEYGGKSSSSLERVL